MRVAIFGGSFNPPHTAHVLAARYALEAGFDKVLAVVVHTHAFAKQLASFEHRVRMCELAFVGLERVEVSRIEQSLPAPNYTLTTVQAIAAAHPDWQLRLLVGSDVLKDVHAWHAFDEVVKRAPLLVLGRADDGGVTEVAYHGIVQAELPRVSSSEVRRALALVSNGSATSGEREWLALHVPKGVLDYALEHHLYDDG
ncbi:MAG TPA: nicotinate-nicotinamide nucleotide adenylyltransferase [Polyangiaceae bacterium]|nr:nicotinate-nicotinamide nucleotide adenylyltransferase [Polyangiaceae bacterium]